MRHVASLRGILFLLVVMFTSTGIALSQATTTKQMKTMQGALDGMTFVGEGGEKGKAMTEKDIIKFKKGRLHSEACDVYGFDKGKYTTTKSSDVTMFEAETISKKEGKIQWKGSVKGDVIEGTYIWTKAGQAPIEYMFKGKLKAKEMK
jgi:hypothetical protein